MGNLVTIVAFYRTMDVYLPKTRLESEGIEVLLRDELISVTKVLRFVYLILISFLTLSCNYNIETDEQVINDILPQIIDSANTRMINGLIPYPSAPGIVDKIADLKFRERQRQSLKRMDSIDSRLLIGLHDTCFSSDLNNLLEKEYPHSLFIRNIVKNNKSDGGSHILDFSLIKAPDGIQIISETDLLSKYPDIWDIRDRRFGGLFYISRLYFDSEKKSAIIEVVTVQGPSDSSHSDYILLERIGGKWKVKKHLMNWIM